jgi:hypothetical protein
VALAFLSLFHLLGGGALGVALRPLRARPAGTRGCGVSIGLVVWAVMFGGIPLFMSLADPWLLPFQLLELVVAFLAAFFFWDQIRETFGKTNVVITAFGGVFFMAGCAALGFLIRERDWLLATVIGLLFSGLGLALVLFGLRRTLSSPADSEDQQ